MSKSSTKRWTGGGTRGPEFVYRHRWAVGDAVLWDNRCTQHCATEFDEARHRRRMHRTTLEGEPLLLAEPFVSRPPRR